MDKFDSAKYYRNNIKHYLLLYLILYLFQNN